MVWVVFTILLGVCFAGAAFFFFGNDKGTDNRFWAVVAMILTVVVFFGLTVGLSIATLSTGQVGLVYNFAGKLTGVKENPGVIWKAPWSHIRKESVQIQREQFVLDPTNAAVTKDQQEITANLVINYQVDPRHVLGLYKTVGPSWKQKLIDSRVLQDFKEVTATYPTVQITNHREQLRKDTRTQLQNELRPYSIDVTDFFIQNIGFSRAYTDAITRKQVQVQAAQQAQAKVAQAQAEARQKVAQATGEATAIRVQGEALRANPGYLQLAAIQKLAPKASLIICTGTTCPSIIPASITGLNKGGK